MKNKFQENGLLTEEGQTYLKSFKNELNKILETKVSIQELAMLGSVLHKMIGDAVSDKAFTMRQMANKANALWKMSDEEFQLYLCNKYGENFTIFTTMTEEESNRYEPIAKVKTAAIMQKLAEEHKNYLPLYQKTPWFPGRRKF